MTPALADGAETPVAVPEGTGARLAVPDVSDSPFVVVGAVVDTVGRSPGAFGAGIGQNPPHGRRWRQELGVQGTLRRSVPTWV
ncbi:hypothetical protein [Streptomyces sp. NPDC059786]|uniref:hypothetical protein n=1 Tax=Streptomyces sp. NPDC059786 TaxID=3346946 RepID=UPI0036611FB2